MLSTIQNWFKRQFKDTNQTPEHSVELATAVLLYEVMRADHKFEQVEFNNYHEQLEKHFDLTQLELEEL